jgi:hypothetical protein
MVQAGRYTRDLILSSGRLACDLILSSGRFARDFGQRATDGGCNKSINELFLIAYLRATQF